MAELPIFGQLGGTVPQSASVQGMQDTWFTCPFGWGISTDSDGVMWVTDTDGNRYAARTDIDGVVKFQSLMLAVQRDQI